MKTSSAETNSQSTHSNQDKSPVYVVVGTFLVYLDVEAVLKVPI
jgi:hypothetical protein